jgi:hypothetical protein
MTCQLCLCFLQDTLEVNSSLSSEKLLPLRRMIVHELYRLVTQVQGHHSMILRIKREYLAMVEKKIHTPAKSLELYLFDAALNYYKYIDCNALKKKELEDTIQFICYELLSAGVCKYSKSTDPLLEAKQLILKDYFMVLEHLKEIHTEHSGSQDANTIVFLQTERISEEEIDSWNNLYT